MREGVAVDERLGVPGGESVAALSGGGLDVVHFEDARDSLLLEPLARVALVGSGRGRELGRRDRAVLGQRPVVAEAVAEMDGHELVGAERGPEEPPGEGIALCFLGLGRHLFSRGV
jgi:hypothetical protein